ncbi:DUF6286 domain-containing protein [Aeromicrobium sp. CF3.5]|uniref:DUF6286 domain-containing protein n=1 Tax=Aeromicrobium sp. CF3.5 TaxID=3373078 RepID=UPI003EE554B3
MTTTRGPEPEGRAMSAAKEPVGTGSAPLFAQLIALLLIGVGVVAVQHLLVTQGAISGASWLGSVVDAADGVQGSSPAVLTVGIVAVVLGVLLLPVVFKPRPRTSLTLAASTGVHLTPKDVARIVASAVDDADSITDVSVTATRRKVRVRATTVAPKNRASEVSSDLRQKTEPLLATFSKPPRLAISLDHDI